MDAEEIIRRLGLKPHPGEGGYYRETYRSADLLSRSAPGNRYGVDKSLCTAIYYLLTPDSFSALHRLRTDEIFHFYLGDPVILLRLYPGGQGETLVLGPDLALGQSVQAAVSKGTWQGLCLNPGGRFALLGTTVSPGFDFEDFELARRADLLEEYPEYRELIRRLTPAHRRPPRGVKQVP